MSEDKIYTATDLSRYHAGEMSPQEMHALEKAALSDPFLADAIEGYAYAQAPEQDIVELKQRLSGKQDRSKIFFLRPGNRWMSIAAMLVVFAGAGYCFYRFNETEKVKTEAKLEQPAPKRETEQATDTEITPVQNGLTVHQDHKITPKTTTSKLTTVSSNYTITKPTTAEVPEDRTVLNETQNVAAAPPVVETKRVLKSLRNDYEVKGSVTDAKGAPVEGASININSNNKTVTDEEGKFYAQTTTPTVTASVVSSGFAKKDVQLSSTADNNIALHKYDAQKPTAMNRANTQLKENKELLKKAVESDQLTWQEYGKMEPIDSIVFTDYADKNIKTVRDSAGTEYSGKVLLSFTVNKKGRPENIKVDQPLCKSCDEQAVQLLKNGPNWIYVPAKRKQVSVEF